MIDLLRKLARLILCPFKYVLSKLIAVLQSVLDCLNKV